MRSCSKVVAFVTAVVLLMVPAAAWSSCWLHMAKAEKCTPHCPMMKAQSSPVSISETSAAMSCCQVSSGKPEELPVPSTPVVTGIPVSPTTHVSILDAVTFTVRAEFPDFLSRMFVPSLQASLCTFLI
jgi:hypothetical protein